MTDVYTPGGVIDGKEDIEARANWLQDVIKLNPLPDSRLSLILTAKGAQRRGNMWWMPIYCGNCGKEGGLVPETTSFVAWLCAKCEHFGHIDGCYMEPDRIFWAKLELEQLETYGRRLSDIELVSVAQAEASPLATLIKQGR